MEVVPVPRRACPRPGPASLATLGALLLRAGPRLRAGQETSDARPDDPRGARASRTRTTTSPAASRGAPSSCTCTAAAATRSRTAASGRASPGSSAGSSARRARGETDSGGRTWGNDADGAKRVIDATVAALQAEYHGRVRSRAATSSSASARARTSPSRWACAIPPHWNRWLILAANDKYWWGDAPQLLETNRAKIRRVYLFTGENDQVVENTKRVGEMLKDAHIRVKVRIAPGLGHEVPADRMITNYRRPLRWLARGG